MKLSDQPADRFRPSDVEWLETAAAILQGRDASPAVRRKAASYVRKAARIAKATER
jgi:hypothetical protein